ncbi:MAG: ATP phosphoribosyltransferase regulatory subunit [Gammaproteobacteria bacterium]|jgi:ATP phosphoribosyltransferase regulatory subunit|nr:ATP phosphoribosyltransferase regulatory subunit [Gammaproteobacteria bacterium]
MNDERWLLPEGIDELLPPDAWQLEGVRRRLLDVFRCWGYELVIPPFIEYLESLLTGTGRDLELQTFKLTDQLSGRMMGVRADITPQAARIDAHQLRREEPTRLCYIGTVLHTRPDGFAGSRSPLQLGAELYGHSGVDSDVEILSLMMQILGEAGVRDVHLDLGHVGIFRGLARAAGLSAAAETELFDALQRKAEPEIEALVRENARDPRIVPMLLALAELSGGADVIDLGRRDLAGAPADVIAALDYVDTVAGAVRRRFPDLPLHVDLAELRAYHYQTGVVFAAFVPGEGGEIARGGRYDDIGREFGRARPATGFSADLKTLLRVAGGAPAAGGERRVLAPAVADTALDEYVAALRRQGTVVVHQLPGQRADARAMGCTDTVVREAGGWLLKPV